MRTPKAAKWRLSALTSVLAEIGREGSGGRVEVAEGMAVVGRGRGEERKQEAEARANEV